MSQHSSRGTAWEATRAAVLERDQYTCVYDGAPATTVDHVIPKVAGGTDEMSNLVASCLPCNAKKGAKALVRQPWFNPRWLDGIW